MTPGRLRWWSYARALAVQLLLWGLLFAAFWEPIQVWLWRGDAQDRGVLREWIDESRTTLGSNLRVLVEDYLQQLDEYRAANPDGNPDGRFELIVARNQIREFLDTLGTPPKMYNTLPLFPTLYQMHIRFRDDTIPPIKWDSLLPEDRTRNEPFSHALGERASIEIRYQMHAYDRRQREEVQRHNKFARLSVLAIVATSLAVVWFVYSQRREQEQERQRLLAQTQVEHAERLLLQGELRRQEAEHGKQEAERDLLQQQLAAQEYEQTMLEMKSQVYASIGIMAGSYAHNIKNLLVRPNDLLRRCLETDSVSPEQTHMLQEVRHTLGTVTERLQQILQTVRRDPARSEASRLDLRMTLRNLEQTWKDLARERWKLQLAVEEPPEPLWLEGDVSHLQQAVENLLFNSRDATFEMRTMLREQAREGTAGEARKQALIAAAAWKGSVKVRAWREGNQVVLEMRDNGIGMTEDVRQRCTETHFSTKRDNALFEGHSTGMGLGLSFVQVVTDNHAAKLEIESRPLEGATFRIRFPALAER